MSTLEKLKKIEKERDIYNIVYRVAGVAFMFYDPEADDGDWKKSLYVNKYYDTFEEAVEGEYKRLVAQKDLDK